MGKLSTVFGILAALLAIATAVLTFLVRDNYQQFGARSEALADTVVKTVAGMNQESNTDVAGAVTFTAGEKPKDEDGTLSWTTYKASPSDYQGTLDKATGLATDLNRQRNDLADTLYNVALELQLPDTEVDPGHLRDLGDPDRFPAATGTIQQHAAAVAARDKAMVRTLVQAAADIDHPIEEQVFTARESRPDAEGDVGLGDYPCRGPLDGFAANVQGLKQRCDDYAQAIIDGINRVPTHKWEADTANVRDQDEYEGALTSLLNDFDDINEKLAQYEQAKIELEEYKQKVAILMQDIDKLRADLDERDEDLHKAKMENKALREKLGLDGTVEVATDDSGEISPDLEGTVLQVNNDWNYVILDLGRTSRLYEDLELLVARESQLVCKLMVSKVMGSVSIAEILPQIQTENVQVGDRVILPGRNQAAPEATN